MIIKGLEIAANLSDIENISEEVYDLSSGQSARLIDAIIGENPDCVYLLEDETIDLIIENLPESADEKFAIVVKHWLDSRDITLSYLEDIINKQDDENNI